MATVRKNLPKTSAINKKRVKQKVVPKKVVRVVPQKTINKEDIKNFCTFSLCLAVFSAIGGLFLVIMFFDGAPKVYTLNAFAIYMEIVIGVLLFLWYRKLATRFCYSLFIVLITTLIISTSSILYYNVMEFLG